MNKITALFSCFFLFVAPEIIAQDTKPLKFTVEEAPEWSAMFTRDSGWFGGDGIFSIPLDGVEANISSKVKKTTAARTLFVFSDSMIGELKDGKLQPGSKMIHNATALLTGTEPVAENMQFFWKNMRSGAAETIFEPKTPKTGPADYYWLGDGFVNQELDNAIFIFGYRVKQVGDGAFGFEEVGNTLIKIEAGLDQPFVSYQQKDTPFYFSKDDPRSAVIRKTPLAAVADAAKKEASGLQGEDLALEKDGVAQKKDGAVQEGGKMGQKNEKLVAKNEDLLLKKEAVAPKPESGSFGAGILVNTKKAGAVKGDKYIYVYGVKGPDKKLLVARVLPKDFENYTKWMFWDGIKWNPDMYSSAAVTDGVSNELSVSALPNGKYALIFQEGGLSRYIAMRIGRSPTGPFGPPIRLWDCSAALTGKSYFPYNAKAHPSLSKEGELLISYNINSFEFFKDLENDPQLYRPRFIRVKFE
ncbi:MAG TPA: DUF4185 domain-containing protein [Pedobacter sp.]|nr:DUF4185 domain-containing protein [Pedobacter sp.]